MTEVTQTRWRKKPVVIEAMQWRGHSTFDALGESMDYVMAFEEWIEPLAKAVGRWPLKYRGQSLIIPTLEGDHEASPGDWIIRGVQGELYPCKPDIFAATYEPADNPEGMNPEAATAERDALLERALVFVTECADEDRADAVALMMEIEQALGGRDERD